MRRLADLPGALRFGWKLLLLAGAVACGPHAGSQTNWLRACDSDSECGDLQCICGACTVPCAAETACSDQSGAACVSASDVGATALCGGHLPPTSGLCLQRCESEDDCPQGSACVAGVCSPLPPPTVEVTIDRSTRYQSLVGFGASFGYAIDEVAQHPNREALYDAFFADGGMNLIRVRNRFGHEGEEDLTSAVEVVSGAAERLGSRPTVLLNSASPPGALKANGTNMCGGDADTCTLVTLPTGSFDYAGLAAYWRDSIEAYSSAGVPIDFINVQNNPNWVPPASTPREACRFLPTEGTATVTVDETEIEVSYPGLAEALTAVAAELEGLPSPPGIIAPEATGYQAATEYLPHLDMSNVDAIGHHLYGTDAATIDAESLAELASLGEQYERPIFQTEMQADGFDTAVLLHHTLAVLGASAYLQNDFIVSAALSPNPAALAALDDAGGITLQGPYHALRHYASFTAPGWVRVAATSNDDTSLLTSAWLGPTEDALAVVLVNTGITEQVVRLEPQSFERTTSRVVRTVFEGIEASTELGSLPGAGILRIPGRSIVTVELHF